MLQKHRQVLILIVGLLYVYSVCPLLCATVEQRFCQNVPQKALHGVSDARACCQGTKTADKAETPSDSGQPCCSTDLELVLPDDRHNTHELRESIAQSLVSILPISTIVSVTASELFYIFPGPLTTPFFPDHSLTYRGPPLS